MPKIWAVAGHAQRDKWYYTHDLFVEKVNQAGFKPGHDRNHGAGIHLPGTIKTLLSKYTVVNTDIRKSANGEIAPVNTVHRRVCGEQDTERGPLR